MMVSVAGPWRSDASSSGMLVREVITDPGSISEPVSMILKSACRSRCSANSMSRRCRAPSNSSKAAAASGVMPRAVSGHRVSPVVAFDESVARRLRRGKVAFDVTLEGGQDRAGERDDRRAAPNRYEDRGPRGRQPIVVLTREANAPGHFSSRSSYSVHPRRSDAVPAEMSGSRTVMAKAIRWSKTSMRGAPTIL